MNFLRKKQLQQRLQQDPYYRLQSLEEVALAATLGIKIDVNRATIDDWLRLPGISIHQGRSLVELSRSGVKFYCIEDIAAALNVPVQRVEPLKPVLSFSYSDQESLTHATQINPNKATLETLINIPFIDSDLAKAVVENRMTNGNYRNLVDFQQRLGLSGEAIAQLMYYLRF